MITTSKLTAPKNKMAPVTCVVGHSVISIYAMTSSGDLRVINRRTGFSTRTLATREVSRTHIRSYRYAEVPTFWYRSPCGEPRSAVFSQTYYLTETQLRPIGTVTTSFLLRLGLYGRRTPAGLRHYRVFYTGAC